MIVYADMVADLFHSGHINFFKKIIDKYPNCKLYIGLMSDNEAKEYKRLPYLNIDERYISVSTCRYVDKVFKNAVMPITSDFIKKNKIDKVIHANDISTESKKFWYKIPLELNIYDEVEYTTDISTTDIINRIKNS
tara:strand:- start:28 stop:435 length:408 start_codon:yes stop_codon:yes gene_type:complete